MSVIACFRQLHTRGRREDTGASYPFFRGEGVVSTFSISAKRLIASRMI